MVSKLLGPKLYIALSSIALVLASGTVIFHRLEDWSWVQSFYFTVVTTTTVGYGDLYPTTDQSRLVTSIFMLIGVTVLVTSIGYIGAHFASRREKKIRRR